MVDLLEYHLHCPTRDTAQYPTWMHVISLYGEESQVIISDDALCRFNNSGYQLTLDSSSSDKVNQVLIPYQLITRIHRYLSQ